MPIKEKYNPTYPIYMTDGTVGIEAAFDSEIPALVGDGFMTMVTSAIFRYDDQVASGWITDGYREYLEWALSMMDEGIMTQDFLSLDTDRMVQNTMQASGDIGIWRPTPISWRRSWTPTAPSIPSWLCAACPG